PTKRPPSERRFKCDQCERMFFTRKDVKRHLVVHTGIRNFACPYCTQRFGRKDHLVRHAKKSHNRDTRSSTALKATSSSATNTSTKSHSCPTLIQPKSATIPVLGQQLPHNHNNHMKQTLNYPNGQNGDHSALVLLSNNNNNHHNSHTGVDNHCSGYGNHSNPNLNALGMTGIHSNDSLCHYMSGVHSFDEMMASNGMKSETPHHYFTFPVNSTPLTYPLPNPPFLPNCLVSNSSANMSSCGSTATVAAFGIPVPNVSNVSTPIHTTFSVDVNPSLPHFNQAFQ
ncbi:unnamed protein product, partial [Oppiella nova]